MRRAFLDDAVATAPSPTGASSEGHPTDGDVARGIRATAIGAFYFYMVQEAIVTVIERAGLAPNDDPNQFRDALLGLMPDVASFATQAWVRARIADLVDSSPAALDTLNELAAALGDDANFAATVNAALALRARLDGAAFTDAVRFPTPPADDNSTRGATTEWVRAKGRPRLDSIAAAGITPTADNAGTPIALNASLAGFTFVEMVANRVNGDVKTPMPSLIPTSELPDERDARFYGGQVAGNGIYTIWTDGNTTLRVQDIAQYGAPTVFAVFGVP